MKLYACIELEGDRGSFLDKPEEENNNAHAHNTRNSNSNENKRNNNKNNKFVEPKIKWKKSKAKKILYNAIMDGTVPLESNSNMRLHEIYSIDPELSKVDAMDIERSKFLQDKSRHSKYFLLQWLEVSDAPSNRLELSTKMIYQHDPTEGEDEVDLPMKYFPVKNRHPVIGEFGKQLSSMECSPY